MKSVKVLELGSQLILNTDLSTESIWHAKHSSSCQALSPKTILAGSELVSESNEPIPRLD